MRTHAKTQRSQVTNLLQEHRRLLRQYNRVSHYATGFVAGLYLPGLHQTFDVAVRKITGSRPIFITLEANETGLFFVGAISRQRAGKLCWQTIFNYEFSIPMTPRGGGRVLSAKNIVLAKRGIELLATLLDFARGVAENRVTDVPPAVFPTIVRRGGKIVAEDYTTVLGMQIPNPAATLEMVPVRRYNVAPKVLARRGLTKLDELAEEMWPVVMAEFRAEYPEFSIAPEIVLDALQNLPEHIRIPVPADEALTADPDAVTTAIREKLPARFRYEASHKDLIVAASNPGKPLRISRLSALQVFPVETAQELPEDYAGSVLYTVKLAAPAQPAIVPATAE
jgi:hypothetical protein